MSLCLSAPASPVELGAITSRPTPITRLLQLLRGDAAGLDLAEAAGPSETLAPAPRAPVNVLLL